MLVTGACHDRDLNPGSHACEPNALTTTHNLYLQCIETCIHCFTSEGTLG